MPEFDACCDPAELLDLSGRKGLVVGIANDRSLAWPAALHFRQVGAELAITYVDERTKPHVVPLAARLEAPILLPCDVNAPHELDAVFDAITAGETWISSFMPWAACRPATFMAA